MLARSRVRSPEEASLMVSNQHLIRGGAGARLVNALPPRRRMEYGRRHADTQETPHGGQLAVNQWAMAAGGSSPSSWTASAGAPLVS